MYRLSLVLGKSWTQLSTLQANAITTAPANQCLDSILTFVLWLNLGQIVDPHMLDKILVTFFDAEFLADSPPSVGSKLLAALLHFKPDLGASIKHAFPLATRALRGWHRLRPATTRQPLPLVALGAMVGRCLMLKEIAIALALLVCFSGYLRPRELTSLQVIQLVAPQRHGGPSFKNWCLVLHPQFLAQKSKTGCFDETIEMDSDFLKFANPFFHTLTLDRAPRQNLWPFTHERLVHLFKQTVQDCQLQSIAPVLYSLRHGGASHDALGKKQEFLAIKERGRWSSDKSLARYKKQGRAQLEVAKLPDATVNFGAAILQALPSVFHQPQRVAQMWRDHGMPYPAPRV